MFSYIARLAVVAAFAIPAVLGAPAPVPVSHVKVRTPDISTEVVASSYIVVYNPDISAEAVSSHLETVNSLILSRKRDFTEGGIAATYEIDS